MYTVGFYLRMEGGLREGGLGVYSVVNLCSVEMMGVWDVCFLVLVTDSGILCFLEMITYM